MKHYDLALKAPPAVAWIDLSTLPIKVIAAQVGLGDYHSFGKAMRRGAGRSPRQWRKNAGLG